MNGLTSFLNEDLAHQKKKLDDLVAWKDDAVLIEAQKALITELEQKIEAAQQ